jgi:carbonic anhydrase
MNGNTTVVTAVIVLALGLTPVAGAGEPAGKPPSPDQALRMLEDGNTRFVAGESSHPHTSADRLRGTATGGQQPFATVIACSDSRVPVERIFDRGFGDLFVVRVAGNVCDTDEIGSIEYGVDHLRTPVFVVLGHTHCGAVTAVATDAEVHGCIPALVDNIKPAVERARKQHPQRHGKAIVPAAVEQNVWIGIEDLLRRSKATRRHVAAGTLKVVGAVYDLHSGRVRWLGEHPAQTKLLAVGPRAGSAPRAETPVSALQTPHSKVGLLSILVVVSGALVLAVVGAWKGGVFAERPTA